VTCNLPTLAANGAAKVTIVATVSLSIGATPVPVSNTATVSSSVLDVTTDDQTATVTTSVNPPNADLSLTGKASPSPVAKGGALTYTFTVKNLGPLTATTVTLTETLPDAVTPPATAPAGCVRSGPTLTCTIASLPSGASKAFAIVVTAPNTPGTALQAAGSVGASSPVDLTTSNNRATAPATTKT
jgi:uncharacterized repeat protein (TIGR01451 family)